MESNAVTNAVIGNCIKEYANLFRGKPIVVDATPEEVKSVEDEEPQIQDGAVAPEIQDKPVEHAIPINLTGAEAEDVVIEVKIVREEVGVNFLFFGMETREVHTQYGSHLHVKPV